MSALRSLNVFGNLIKNGFRFPQKASPAAAISSVRNDPDYKRPAPWPYETKKYNMFRMYYEGTYKRFDENTRLLVVDGNIGAGKTSFAKELAKEFDMKYIPETDVARTYITKYGYDLRLLDPIMPPCFKSCDVNTFYQDPFNRNVTLFQYKMFILRAFDYMDALSHILNTGQGVVMDRCVWSDRVFMETMHRLGYVERDYYNHYMEIFSNIIPELMRPCLVVYLDIPPEVALERIKQRNNPIEVNSKVLTLDYLATIDHFYKQYYLKEVATHAEVLIYDWSSYGDVEVVVEDIERIDFDRFDERDEKLRDWRKRDDWEWGLKRYDYMCRRNVILSYGNICRYELDKVWIPEVQVKEYKKIVQQVPGNEYAAGFNTKYGDKNVLFKTNETLLNERYAFFQPIGRYWD